LKNMDVGMKHVDCLAKASNQMHLQAQESEWVEEVHGHANTKARVESYLHVGTTLVHVYVAV
jgi:hypothetical protein